jgi:hypothetical protein
MSSGESELRSVGKYMGFLYYASRSSEDTLPSTRSAPCGGTGKKKRGGGVVQSGPTRARSLVRLVSGATLAEHLGIASGARCGIDPEHAGVYIG